MIVDSLRVAWAWIRKSNARIVGIVILIAFIMIAIFSGAIAPYAMSQHFGQFLHPSGTHLLGTDDLGRDIFSQVILGTTISLQIGFLAAFISLAIGVLVGVVAGYYRGKTEQVLLTITDVAIVIPTLPLLLILVMYLDRGVVSMAVAISIVGWCGMARMLHPRVMNLKEQSFIETARSLGKSDLYIIFKHIIPNCKDVIAARFSLAVGGAILAESGMAFLGFGNPLQLSWGAIINEAYTHGAIPLGLWWWYIVPGALIAIIILTFMMIGTSRDEEKWVAK